MAKRFPTPVVNISNSFAVSNGLAPNRTLTNSKCCTVIHYMNFAQIFAPICSLNKLTLVAEI